MASRAEAEHGVEIAIAPFLSVRTLVHNYEPMRLYLEKQLHQPVLFVTAPDYKIFHERMQKLQYRYLITVANAAYLAETESGYVPLFRPAIPTRPTLVVRKDASLQHLDELRGKHIALPDPLAVISMQARDMLREAGIDPDKDVQIRHVRNHGAAVNFVLSGESDAAIVSDRALSQMPAATREGVRVMQTWDKGAVPGVVYLASPRVPKAEVKRFSQALQDFVNSQEGKALMQRMGYGTLLPTTAADLKYLAPYGAALKEELARNK